MHINLRTIEVDAGYIGEVPARREKQARKESEDIIHLSTYSSYDLVRRGLNPCRINHTSMGSGHTPNANANGSLGFLGLLGTEGYSVTGCFLIYAMPTRH